MAEQNGGQSSRRISQIREYDDNGQPIPEWKMQIYMKKVQKQLELEEQDRRLRREEQERRLQDNKEPHWKHELKVKKHLRHLTSEDPLIVRQRNIKAIQKEIDEEHSPPWQKELLRKRVEKLQAEVDEIEKGRKHKKQERQEALAAPFQQYQYEKNHIEPFHQ